MRDAKCFNGIPPINMSTMQQVNSTAAVLKFAGKMSPQTIDTGIIIGRKPSLKLDSTSRLIHSILATYMMSASLAKSEV